MIVESLFVQNFRCIRSETLDCEDLTVLIGPNGSGKSSFLAALNMFYAPSARYAEDDFYNRDISQDIIVRVTFADLTEDEKQLFQKYVEGGELTVEKVMKWPPSRGNQKYFGTSLQNTEFDAFRLASGAELRQQYNRLRGGEYSNLPEYTNRHDAEKALQEWEETNPNRCIRRRDEGQFFGFNEVGEAHLERFTRFIPVPAVRDACEDAAEGRGTALTEIMDLVVRSVLSERPEIGELLLETKRRYEQIVDPAKLAELQGLEQKLSDTLRTYVPDAGVKLTWSTEESFDIPMPKADIRLVEDKYPSSVERTGHGLQRAFILTMLQHLAIVQSLPREDSDRRQTEDAEADREESSPRVPNLIIGIEEPELYQHPNRQRHLARILLKLATGRIEGVAERTQIIHTTHSPLFVDMRRFHSIRALRKISEDVTKPRQTRVIRTDLDEVAKIIEKVDGKPEGSYDANTLKPRLQTLMTPWMNEGFFAEVAVLVEGEEDRAAILGIAAVQDYDLESLGISVIPCMGKNNLDRPTGIFSKLEIPVYVIWDSDHGKESANPRENHKLLRLFDQSIEDWPENVGKHFACFKSTLGDTLRSEIGEELFEDILKECIKDLGMGKRRFAVKNPLVIQKVISEAQKRGKSSSTLEKIVSMIIALRKPSAS